ncbi:hypothetical protein [Streptomyces sp. G1]|uniref:hypothetical protein n=1 Tax=Streptomyces sp. G1 TaxID=361572 RepID=UPI00202F090C|nr:hypothetical protein [Streptomyces sp. G1]MCM1971336.1 hypothetical protein [Streptomyces sp. G1]
MTATLSQDLQVLTSTPDVPPAVRAVIRKRVFAAACANQGACMAVLTAPFAFLLGLEKYVGAWIRDGEAPTTLRWFLPAAVLYTAPMWWRLWVNYFARGSLRPLRQFVPVIAAIRAIRSCAMLAAATPTSRPAYVDVVSRTLREAERAVLRGPARSGSAPRSSPRRKQLRLHARLVVAALRQAELRLDTDPLQGAKELSRMLISVAENCSLGRLGALLPEEDLKDLQPVRDRTALKETLHLAGALALVGAVGWLGTWYGAKLGIESPWTLIPAAVVAVLIYPRLRRTGPDLLMSYLGP